MEIRNISHVVNQTLGDLAKLAKTLINLPKDELGGHSGIEQNSVSSSCSISSLKPPPFMSSAWKSGSELFSSKTPGMCGAGDDLVVSDKGRTQARGSSPFPSSSSDGDSGFQKTSSGGSTTGSCWGSMFKPRRPIPGVTLFARSGSSYRDSGVEELELRTRRGHGCVTQSLLPLSGKSKVQSFERDLGGDLDESLLTDAE